MKTWQKILLTILKERYSNHSFELQTGDYIILQLRTKKGFYAYVIDEKKMLDDPELFLNELFAVVDAWCPRNAPKD